MALREREDPIKVIMRLNRLKSLLEKKLKISREKKKLPMYRVAGLGGRASDAEVILPNFWLEKSRIT